MSNHPTQQRNILGMKIGPGGTLVLVALLFAACDSDERSDSAMTPSPGMTSAGETNGNDSGSDTDGSEGGNQNDDGGNSQDAAGETTAASNTTSGSPGETSNSSAGETTDGAGTTDGPGTTEPTSAGAETGGGGDSICAINESDGDCNTCTKEQCCDQLETCDADESCSCITDCVDGGGDPNTCQQDCGNSALFDALTSCVIGSCLLQCV